MTGDLTALPPGARTVQDAWTDAGRAPGPGPWDAVVVEGDVYDAAGPAALEERLRPCGVLVVKADGRREGRRIARGMRPYFEGGRPGRERFVPVRYEAARDRVVGLRRGPGLQASHFEGLADEYDEEMPAHIAEAFLQRKVDRIAAAVPPGAERGLELGAGSGHHAAAVAHRTGARIVATDAFPAVVAAGRPDGAVGLSVADAQRLPFPAASFDFVYTINMMHHLKRGEQQRTLQEVRRILRPGGRFIVLEINIRNPLFRFYMRHIFPRTRRIDRGDEEFLLPQDLLSPGWRLADVDYFSFLPDFVPRALMRPMRALERRLESSSLRSQSIHYAATLEAA